MNLPNKLSELILAALVELDIMEEHPNYKVDMSLAHQPQDINGVFTTDPEKVRFCAACFSGGLIAKDIGYDYTQFHGIKRLELDEYENKKLAALDRIRKYNIASALYLVDPNMALKEVTMLTRIEFIEEVPYKENPQLFKENMRKIALHLASFGY